MGDSEAYCNKKKFVKTFKQTWMNVRKAIFASIWLLFILVADLSAKRVDTIVARRWEFIENRAHLPAHVRYFARTDGGSVFFEGDGYTVVQYNPEQLEEYHEAKHNGRRIGAKPVDAFAYRVEFVDCNRNAKLAGNGKYGFHYSFFKGKDRSRWDGRMGVYGEITYEGIYDSINLKFGSDKEHLKYEYCVMPGGDPGKIAMRYSGLKSMVRNGSEILLYTSFGRNVELKPFAYQVDGKGDTVKVECGYLVNGDIVRFKVGGYDRDLVLVIDPTIVFSSYSGSAADNWGYTATYDTHGNLYGGGTVTDVGYPTTLGAYQVDFCGVVDIALSKFSADGTTLLYSTYLGGSLVDIPHSLFVNNNDELYVLGTTSSSDFPTTATAYDTSFNGGDDITLSTNWRYSNGSDIIVSKLSADGCQLVASTYVGGNGNDGLNISTILRKNYADENRGEIEIDDNSNVYIVSTTNSTDFPTTQGCFRGSYSGGTDVCVFKMSQDLSTMVWSTYFGGEGDDAGYSLSLAADNSVYICGGTVSSGIDAVQGGYQSVHADNGGKADGYVAHLSRNGAAIEHFTFLGKAGYDQAYLVEKDREDNVYVFGQTEAGGLEWVSNAGYYNPGGGQFIVKLRQNLGSAVWSTAFGTGNGPDISPTAFMADYCNNIYVSGWGSPQLNGFGGTSGLPVTTDAIQATTDGSDFYFLALNDDASGLVYASYFGGANSSAREHVDGGTSRFDRHGTIYQAVCAGCGGQSSFPTTQGAYSQTNGSSNCNLGVVKIDFAIPTVIADFLIPTVVCLPDSASFFNNTQLVSQYATILWDFGDGTTSLEWNPKHKYNSPGVYTVTLSVFDIESCNNSDTLRKNIFVFANSSTTLSSIDICDNTYAELGMPPAAGVSYHWSPGSSINNATVSNPIATPTSTTVYTLIAETEACIDTFYQEVVVHSLSVSMATAEQDLTICPGNTAMLTVEISSADSYDIQWSDSFDFSNIIASNTTSVEVQPEATKTYYVRVSSQHCIKIMPITVTVSTVEVSLPRRLLCFENELDLDATVSGSHPPFQYLWEVDGHGTATGENPSFNVLQSCEYSVTVTDAIGCTASASDSIIVAENTFTEELQAWCRPPEIFEYHTVTLFVTELGAGYTYQWTPDGDVATPDSSATTATPPESTTYTVTVTDRYGCTKDDTVFVRVNPVNCGNPFVFIPNSFTPNGDGVNDIVFVRSDILAELHFVIYNRWGEKIFETDSQDTGWDGTFKGKECQRGAYDYYLKGTCLDGDEVEMKGSITLIR